MKALVTNFAAFQGSWTHKKYIIKETTTDQGDRRNNGNTPMVGIVNIMFEHCSLNMAVEIHNSQELSGQQAIFYLKDKIFPFSFSLSLLQ